MKKIAFILFLLISTCFVKAQINEVGLFAGGSNYIGDVGSMNYIDPGDLAFGALFKWNVSSRYSYRISAMIAPISAKDSDSDMASRVERGLEFKNTVSELSLGMEFNFFEFDLHDFDKPATPYIYSGISYFNYKNLFFNGSSIVSSGNHSTFAIPIALGFKAKINRRIILGAEIGARYTFTDNLDGSNPVKAPSGGTPVRFGNINSDDWYVFSGIVITYTFNRFPCYNCFEAKIKDDKKRRRSK